MKRSLWIIFGVLVVLATVALFQWAQEGESVAAIEPLTPPPAALPDVRVRHEFVTVSVPPRPENPLPVRTARSSGAKPAAARPIAAPTAAPAVRRASRDASFLERAGRAVIGDGRYRPEPFPRIKN